MNSVAEDILMHYGIPRRSGRYPWGSGDEPYQRNRDFLSRVEELKRSGWKETPENIEKEFGLSTKEYRNEKTIAKDQRRLLDVARAKSLTEDGLGPTEVGRIMGINESTVRSLLDPKKEERAERTKATVDFIKKEVEKNGMVDVGVGVERELNISKERLDLALYYLETKEGYPIYNNRFSQVTNPGQWTTQRVICKHGTEYPDVYNNIDKIHALNEDNYISRDGGETYERKFTYPSSMDSKRLMIRYSDDKGPDGATGNDKDGIVELRRGVEDLSLGESRYAQVRILVDDKKYIKGMAVYSDDMPDGVDVIFNTNKTRDKSKLEVLKDISKDPENPFGSLIKDANQGGQYWYTDSKTGEKKLGLINKRADEGDWTEWKDALPSQFLGKQNISLAKKQLNLAKADKLAEFDELSSLTNPTVKKHLLQKFADECDSAAVHLQAAALPGQKYHVIIPVNSLKETEIYAPQYESGTKLALIRYPHGGTFEIPIVTVNNKHAPAKKLIGEQSIDAVGINKKVADRLSGADFDGDTVMCIPTHDKGGRVKISSRDELEGLVGFDPKLSYPERKGMKYMKDPVTGKDNTQAEMGKISNLITDMTLAGASDRDLAAAVRHSMVVIDAGKHKLDYKKSEIDNNITALKKKYRAKYDEEGNVIGYSEGADTILSKAKGQKSVVKRQGSPKINVKGEEWYDPNRPEGALIYKTADDAYYETTSINKRTGQVTTKTITRKQKSTNMAETDDAYTLVSDSKHPMEIVYADYANSMKSLANKARMEVVRTGKITYSASAKSIYQDEVNSLNDKLNTALLNSPRERAAQRKANADVKEYAESDPTLKKSDLKKKGQQALTKYREELGSATRKDRNIDITDREWEAIQAGAISENQLTKILANTDVDKLRQRATPKTTGTLSTAKINRAKSLQASNYTLAEIAKKLGVSTATVSKYLKS